MIRHRIHRRAANRAQINVSDDIEVRYWTKHFGVDDATLKLAVYAAGIEPKDVRHFLDTGVVRRPADKANTDGKQPDSGIVRC